MGLADRQYMRGAGGGAMAIPMWMALLIINTVIYIVQQSLSYDARNTFEEYGALSLYGLKHGWIWQLLTFQFLHGSFTHLLFNMLGLWMFGRNVEMFVGKRKLLTVYLL